MHIHRYIDQPDVVAEERVDRERHCDGREDGVRRQPPATLRYTTLQLLYYTILYYTSLYYNILYCTILYSTILYTIILYYTTRSNTIQHYTILHSAILYCAETVPYTRSPQQDSRLQDFRQGLGCSEIICFTGSG